MEINKNCCSSCLSEGLKGFRCSNCKMMRYCNVECQKADWKNHKKVCSELKDKGNVVKNMQDLNLNDLLYLVAVKLHKKRIDLEELILNTHGFLFIIKDDKFFKMVKNDNNLTNNVIDVKILSKELIEAACLEDGMVLDYSKDFIIICKHEPSNLASSRIFDRSQIDLIFSLPNLKFE